MIFRMKIFHNIPKADIVRKLFQYWFNNSNSCFKSYWEIIICDPWLAIFHKNHAGMCMVARYFSWWATRVFCFKKPLFFFVLKVLLFQTYWCALEVSLFPSRKIKDISMLFQQREWPCSLKHEVCMKNKLYRAYMFHPYFTTWNNKTFHTEMKP